MLIKPPVLKKLKQIYTHQRMDQIVEHVRALAQQQGVDQEFIEHLYREMFQYFIQRELKEFRP